VSEEKPKKKLSRAGRRGLKNLQGHHKTRRIRAEAKRRKAVMVKEDGILDIDKVLERLDLQTKELARLMGIDERTVRRWRARESKPRKRDIKLIEALLFLDMFGLMDTFDHQYRRKRTYHVKGAIKNDYQPSVAYQRIYLDGMKFQARGELDALLYLRRMQKSHDNAYIGMGANEEDRSNAPCYSNHLSYNGRKVYYDPKVVNRAVRAKPRMLKKPFYINDPEEGDNQK
jgi:DNA-binding transcriptional regulator YiaG